MVICSLTVSHQTGRTALQAAPLRNLCVLRVSALDSSSLGLTLNLQSEVRRLSRPEIPIRSGLSTFNRVSFLSPSSPHLCALCVLCGENSSSFRSFLIPRHSPLATNSFIIRTSETPLPQLLYNPHLQALLGSAGNKGLITPLESALTKNFPVSRLESALAEKWGWGPCSPLGSSSLTTHQPQITTHVALPNRPRRPYHRSFAPSPPCPRRPSPASTPSTRTTPAASTAACASTPVPPIGSGIWKRIPPAAASAR